MPLNPEIILGYKAPKILTGDERQAQALNLQNLMNVNQEGNLKLQAYRDQQAKDAQYEQAFKANPNLTPNDLLAQGLVKEGMAYGKYQAEQNKSKQDVLKSQLDNAAKKAEFGGQAAMYVMQNPSPENAHMAIDRLASQGILTPEEAQQEKLSIPQDPSQIAGWAEQHVRQATALKDQLGKIDIKNIGGSTITQQADPITGKVNQLNSIANTQSPDSIANNQRMAAEGAANRANQLTIANNRNSSETGKVPSGYRMTPDGNLQAIPGGPADLKLAGAFNQDTAALTGSTNSFDRLSTAANELLNAKGLSGITGIKGSFPNVPGTSAADAQAKLDTLKSQVGFGVLQDMRNNSKTGGALGSVSDAEGKRLEANLAALDKAQSEGQMRESLQKIIDYSEQAKGRLRDAYNLKHGDSGNQYRQAQPASSTPMANLPPTNRKGWSLHVDAQGNKAYVSPNGKDYEEVQ